MLTANKIYKSVAINILYNKHFILSFILKIMKNDTNIEGWDIFYTVSTKSLYILNFILKSIMNYKQDRYKKLDFLIICDK